MTDHDSQTERVRGEWGAVVRIPAIHPSPRTLSPCGVCVSLNGHGAREAWAASSGWVARDGSHAAVVSHPSD
jgi:hypothetical protein